MKDIFGILITVLGGYILQIGFNLLSEKTQKKFIEEFIKQWKSL